MRAAHPYSRFLSSSLRTKVAVGVVLPLVLILGALTAIEYARHREAVLTNVSLLASHSGAVIEYNLRHEFLDSNFAGVQGLVDTLGESGEFRVVYVLDPSGRVIFAPNGKGDLPRLDYRQPDCQPCHRLAPEARPASVVVTVDDGDRVFRSMRPLDNSPACAQCHDPEQRLLGLLLTDVPMGPLERALQGSFSENLLWRGAIILATVIVVNLAMSRLVIRRLQRVAYTLAGFGRGQLDLRLPADSPDEIGQLAGAFNEMGQSIQSEEARNQALSAELQRHAARQRDLLKRLISAQEEERRRVARDLHDDLGQDLAGLAVGLDAVERLQADQPEEARSQLRQVRTQIAEMTGRAYDMILALRPSALDDLGLVPALRAHAERTLNHTGIRFELEAHEMTYRLPPEVETALFRTFQEALSNVVRHSGATRARLSLAVRDGVFEGEVVDDGRGFEPETVQTAGSDPRGLGLLGMQERVAQCGGTLEVFSRPGAGSRVQIRIPLEEASRV